MGTNVHNVSVRLSDSDYKQLQYLHDKYNKRTMVSISYADILRVAVRELYLVESKGESTLEVPMTSRQQEEEKQEEAIKTVAETKTETKPKPTRNTSKSQPKNTAQSK